MNLFSEKLAFERESDTLDEPFNPYVEWLGLTESTVRPDHYRLLGLPPFESDARRITAACDGMLAKVRSNRPGAHLREWQALLDELTSARNCLLDDQTKTKYDAHLRNGDDSSDALTVPVTSSVISAPSGGYMWPPGFEPPGAKAATAPSPAPAQPARQAIPAVPAAPATIANSSSASPASTVNANAYPPTGASNGNSYPPGGPANANAYPPTSQPAAPAVPVLSPIAPAAEMPADAWSPPTSQPAAAWAQPAPQPGGYSAPQYGGNSQGSYPAPTYGGSPNQGGYASPVMPSAAPNSGIPTAMPTPPGAPYGAQGIDPMAPVVSPLGAPVSAHGAFPLAQPIGSFGATAATPYATAAPAAYPAVPYAQPYGQPGAQAVAAYGAPVATAMPVAAVPVAGMPVGGMPMGGMPTASAVGMGVAQAGPMRAAVPVQAIGSAAAEPELGLQVPKNSATKAYKQSRQKNAVSTAVAALLAASLLVIAAFFAFLKDGNPLAHIPRDAKELPIPTDVPPPVDPNAAPPTTVILAPLGDDSPRPKPPVKKPKKSTIGPLVEGDGEGQTPVTIPLVTPEMTNTAKPESAIPEMKVPEKTPMPETPAPMSTASPEETAAVRKALGQAIMAMGYRDWDTATEKLAEAKALAPDDVLKQKVEAVESVSTGAQEFWRAVRESTKSLGAGQELTIGSTRIAVVEASEKLLILRVGGQNKRYPIDDLPMGLARTLATTWFDNNAPSTKVFTGAFLYVEPNGDPAEVRQLWQAAQQGGVNVELLMSLLEDADLKSAGKDDADKS